MSQFTFLFCERRCPIFCVSDALLVTETLCMFSLKPWDPKITTNRLPNENKSTTDGFENAWYRDLLQPLDFMAVHGVPADRANIFTLLAICLPRDPVIQPCHQIVNLPRCPTMSCDELRCLLVSGRVYRL